MAVPLIAASEAIVPAVKSATTSRSFPTTTSPVAPATVNLSVLTVISEVEDSKISSPAPIFKWLFSVVSPVTVSVVPTVNEPDKAKFAVDKSPPVNQFLNLISVSNTCLSVPSDTKATLNILYLFAVVTLISSSSASVEFQVVVPILE